MEIKNSVNKNKKEVSYIKIDSGIIYGLYGTEMSNLKKTYMASFFKKQKQHFFSKKIIVQKNILIDLSHIYFKTSTPKSEINYYCKRNKFKDKSFKSVIEKYLLSFGFELDVLDKKFSYLSASEKILFYIFINTLFDFDSIIFENISYHIDKNKQNVIKNLLLKLKSENKTIIINDNDINILYDFCDSILYFKNDILIKEVKKEKYHDSISELVEKKLAIPDTLMMIYLAKTRKKIKLTYLDDVRDIIKDIYKHV